MQRRRPVTSRCAVATLPPVPLVPAPPPRVSPVPLHLVTPEYPPQIGGVSDYTRAMASRLAAAGREVHVWAPGNDGPAETTGPTGLAGVFVHRVAGTWTRPDRARVAGELDRFPGPRRLLVHWVPHGYEPRGLARGFVRWLRERRQRAGDRVELIIHEPGVGFEGGWRQWVLAVLHREMLVSLLGTAARVWLSTPAWGPRLSPWRTLANLTRLGSSPPPVHWLPLLLDVPVVEDAAAVAAARVEFATVDHGGNGKGELLGHFGTYGAGVTRLLGPALTQVLGERPTRRALLLGRGGERYLASFRAAHPALAGRVHATGETDGTRLSILLQSCDLLLQPYPDGITTRRTSALAVLAHGRAMVTTTGHLTERVLWESAGACRVVVPAGLAAATGELLDDDDARATLGDRGRAWFEREFVGCDYGARFADGAESA